MTAITHLTGDYPRTACGEKADNKTGPRVHPDFAAHHIRGRGATICRECIESLGLLAPAGITTATSP